MAINGDAIRSAGQTFFSVLTQLKDEKRRDAKDARDEARYQDEERWRRVTMAMQEKQDARSQESHDASMKSVGLQLAEMEREAGETKEFVAKMGMSPEQWGQMAEMEKFELYKQMQNLTMQQIETNMSATRAGTALQSRLASFQEAEAERRRARDEMDFEMDKAAYDDFKANKGMREAGAVVGAIEDQLAGVTKTIDGYRDEYGALDMAKVPIELQESQAELRQMHTLAIKGQFSDEMYKRLGIDRRAPAGSSEAETEAQRLQRQYGAGGAGDRKAASEEALKAKRAAAAAAHPRNQQFYYIDGQGTLQGTNDAGVISALEKMDPERVLDSRLVHKGYIGKPYSPRRSSATTGRAESEQYVLPEAAVPLMPGLGGPFSIGF